MTGSPRSYAALHTGGRLPENITHFARALRVAGLAIGPGRVEEALRAVTVAGFTGRADFYNVLQAVFVSRPEERQVFAEVFRLFWRDPRYLEHMMGLLLPEMRGTQAERPAAAAARRAAEALTAGAAPPPEIPAAEEGEEIALEARASVSEAERLRSLDFEQMSTAEIARAQRMVRDIAAAARPLPSRRPQPGPGPLPDWRASLRAAGRTGGEITALRTRRRGQRPPDLVVLCDISGSMSGYSRMVLHFLHALANAPRRRPRAGVRGSWGRVEAFTFGTRLTRITRHLVGRDVDRALAAAGAEAQDWQGGTRIGDCLARFNRDWSRRVLGRGAVVLLITDGLDRGPAAQLAAGMERLHLSCRRLVWLNPLLRWEGFAPRATGIATMLPHVDSFRAGHSLATLEDLARALAEMRDAGEKPRLMQLLSRPTG